MALRVLLADENVTIKKVIQLSLQDYAVTVKSVNLGIDVLDIARNFQPDIVFADVLLQKRNGYEVCTDFKTDPELSNIPFILMWSGFMEVDQEKFQSCQADAELEKPFDKEALRSLIQKWVPTTQENELSAHIETPDLPEVELEPEQSRSDDVLQAPSLSFEAPSSQATEAPPAKEWSMDSFQDIEQFVQKPLSAINENQKTEENQERPLEAQGPDLLSSEEENESWSHSTTPNLQEVKEEPSQEPWSSQDLSEFKINFPQPAEEENSSSAQFSVDYSVADEPVEKEFVQHQPGEPEKVSTPEPSVEPTEDIPEMIQPLPQPQLSEKQMEDLLKAQSKDVIESVVWKIVPDLAEKIIREKLDNLMKDLEQP